MNLYQIKKKYSNGTQVMVINKRYWLFGFYQKILTVKSIEPSVINRYMILTEEVKDFLFNISDLEIL